MGSKNIRTNIYRIQQYESRFFDFMLKDKIILEYTNLFSPNQYERNDKIILKYFQ